MVKWSPDIKRIKQVRELKQLSYEDLGQLIGKTKVSISKWEKGITYPNLSDVCAIANAIDIDPRVFFSCSQNTAPEKARRKPGRTTPLAATEKS